MFGRPDTETAAPIDEDKFTPEEEAAWTAGVTRVAEEKQRALRDPGPSWREWLFFEHRKWWYGVACLVVDSWVSTAWVAGDMVSPLRLVGLAVSTGWAIYLELLLYRYLWRRPASGSGRRFRPGFLALQEVGRWTPEAARTSVAPRRQVVDEGAPNPNEFL